MVKCDVCKKAMDVMHPTDERKDGSLYENLKTKRAFFICTECEERLEFLSMKK